MAKKQVYPPRRETGRRIQGDSFDIMSSDLAKGGGGTYINDIEIIFGGVGEPAALPMEEGLFGVEYVVTTAGTGGQNKPFQYASDIQFTNRTAVLAWVYVEDPSAVFRITLEIYSSLGPSVIWSRSSDQLEAFALQGGQLKQGWNLFRWPTGQSNMSGFGNVTRIRWLYNTTAPIELRFGPVGVEGQPKSRILFVIDGARTRGWHSSDLVPGQTQGGIQDIADRGMKAIWGINPEKVIKHDSEMMTVAQLQELQADPNNDFSFHRYSATALTSTMDYTEMREDVWKAQEWLRDRGFGYTRFRGGVLQNSGPEAKNMIGQAGLRASATGDGNTGALDTFPFRDRGNVRRLVLHGMSNSEIDDWFTDLQNEGATAIFYTHKIVEDGNGSTVDVELSTWQYFLTKIDAGISAGWLRSDNYSSLESEMESSQMIDFDHEIVRLIKESMIELVNS